MTTELLVPLTRWWHCETCDVAWFGQPSCWSCGDSTALLMNSRPDIREGGAAIIIRPHWSTQP